MRLFHDIIKFCKTNILRELRKIFNIFSDRRDVRINRTRGDAKNTIQNIFLVSCLVGRLCGLSIPNSFLEDLLSITRHYDKDTFYKVKRELSGNGIITIGGKKRSQQITLTPQGLSRASSILTGRENENPEWRDLLESAKKHLWVLWPLTIRLKSDERDNLLRTFLILYSRSQGNGPDEFYRSLILNIRNDYRRYGSVDNFYRELVNRLMIFYSKLMRIHGGRSQEEEEALNASLQLITNFITVLHKHLYVICIKTSIAYSLGFRKYLMLIAYLSIASFMYASKFIQILSAICLALILALLVNPSIFIMLSTMLTWPILAVFIFILVGFVLLLFAEATDSKRRS